MTWVGKNKMIPNSRLAENSLSEEKESLDGMAEIPRFENTHFQRSGTRKDGKRSIDRSNSPAPTKK